MKALLHVIALAFLVSATSLAQQTVAEWQAKAIEAYPDLGVPDSPLNKTFLQLHQQLKETTPQLFDNPKWPFLIAQLVGGDPNTPAPPTTKTALSPPPTIAPLTATASQNTPTPTTEEASSPPATVAPQFSGASHVFNDHGYCIRCGWERDFVQRTNRPCIPASTPVARTAATPPAGHVLNEHGYCVRCGWERDFLTRTNRQCVPNGQLNDIYAAIIAAAQQQQQANQSQAAADQARQTLELLQMLQSLKSGRSVGGPTQYNGRPLPRNWIDPKQADTNFFLQQLQNKLNR